MLRDIRRSFRAMAVQPLYTLINIAGLAIGLSVTVLIALFVRDEVSYDRLYTDSG